MYSVGLVNSRRIGTPLVADLKNFVNYDWHDYELDSFENEITRETLSDAPKTEVRPSSRLRSAFSRLASASSSLQLIEESGNLFDERFLDVADGSRLKGYFQSWKYLVPIAEELRNSLWSLKEPSRWFTEKKEQLISRPNFIGVHVRIGNYAKLPSKGVVGEKYYERSLSLLSALGHRLPIVVFSDSPDEVRNMKLWQKFGDVTFFDSTGANSSLETLLLMSLSSHLVIGNSTFSWWAGWIGNEPNREVVYPRPWMNTQRFDDRDLAVPGWIGVSREDIRHYE